MTIAHNFSEEDTGQTFDGPGNVGGAGRLYPEKADDYFDVVRMDAVDRLPQSLGNVLDVGGGNGTTSKFLVEQGLAESSLVVDPFCSAEDSDSVKFVCRSAEDEDVFADLAKRGSLFDTILFLDVLEHLHDPWRVLRFVHPLLRPGGVLLVSVPNARFVALTVPLVLFGRFEYKKSGVMDDTHIRWFTRSSANHLVAQAGFEVEKVDSYVEPRVSLINRMTLGAFRGFFEKQYFIRATIPAA